MAQSAELSTQKHSKSPLQRFATCICRYSDWLAIFAIVTNALQPDFRASLIVGWLIAFFYFIVFGRLGAANWWLGAIGGFVHAALVLTAVLPLLAYIHPRVASEYDGPDMLKRLEPPGFLALHYGYRTPLVTLVAHVAYGTILGAGFSI